MGYRVCMQRMFFLNFYLKYVFCGWGGSGQPGRKEQVDFFIVLSDCFGRTTRAFVRQLSRGLYS